MRIKGTVHIKVVRNGQVIIDRDLGENIVTNVGKAAATSLLGNVAGVPAFTYIAVGTSATAVALTDTALNGEITDSGLQRQSAFSVTRSTTTTTNDTLNVQGVWSVSGTKTVQEMGILNNTLASGTSILLAHKLTGQIDLFSGDTLTLTHKVQLT